MPNICRTQRSKIFLGCNLLDGRGMKDSEFPLANSSASYCRSVLGDGILLFPYSGAGCSWFNCFHGQRFVFLWQLAPMYDECCSNAGFSLCSL